MKEGSRSRARAFVELCGDRLTPQAEVSGFARCFLVFNQKLLGTLPQDREGVASALEADMRAHRKVANAEALRGKPYRQHLCFTLSALAALGALAPETLADLVEEQIPADLPRELRALGCLEGRAGSGNQAMFLGVFLLHARDRLGIATQGALDAWVDLHLRSMNRFGFWGEGVGATHLQFQNGYHQYEILDYLGVHDAKMKEAAKTVRALADDQGHFAPYPGGGGCYDYDAVFLLTCGKLDEETAALLRRTQATLLAQQNEDGGFAENLLVRPRSLGFAGAALCGIGAAAAQGNAPLLKERLRYALTLQRPAHDRIATHWSVYARRWNESDLWDTWFRLLALARIEIALDPAAAKDWGFLDYPGIGFAR